MTVRKAPRYRSLEVGHCEGRRAKFGALRIHLRDISLVRRSRSTNITDTLSAHCDEM